MKPQPHQTVSYEKVKTDDFILGIIEDIEYDKEHTFKGYGKDKEGKPNPDRIGSAVRFKFKLEGYKYPHRSSWLSFSYGKKSNIYNKFLVPLVEGAKPDMDFDLDQLKGMKVKTLWVEKEEFQSVDVIRPVGEKIIPTILPPTEELADAIEDDSDEVPF